MRRSRWSRDPILVGGKPKIAHITERDIEVFLLLTRYRFLSLHSIHAFVGGNLTALRDRLDLLSCRPNLYIDFPLDQHRSAHANYRAMIYELDEKGAAELRNRGLQATKPKASPFAHEVMACQVAASIELARRADPTLDYIPFPLEPIAVRVDGKKHTIISDWPPFVLGRMGNRKFYFGHEDDTGTESLKVIERKLERYLRIIETRQYQHLTAHPKTFYVPFVTFSPEREGNIIDRLLSMTRGKGSEYILFKNIPLFYSNEAPPPATGHMATEPWRRAGYPDFYMAQ